MAGRSRFRIVVEYALLRSACALVNLVPHALAMFFASALAKFAFHVLRFKRGCTMERLHAVFPERPSRELKRIALGSLVNLFKTGVEMIRAPRLTRKWMDAHVVDGAYYRAELQKFVDEGHGVVIMVPHTGNWYMAAWSMAKYGLPLFALAARQRNPKIDAWMKRQYGDIEVLDRSCSDTLGRIKDYLRDGRAFAILPDLRVKHRDVEVEFLGGRANVSRAGAMFAVHAKAPVIVAAMSREKGRHVFNHLATIRPDPEAQDRRAEAERITVEAMRHLDLFIRSHPAEWYWYNKRWILQPVEP